MYLRLLSCCRRTRRRRLERRRRRGLWTFLAEEEGADSSGHGIHHDITEGGAEYPGTQELRSRCSSRLTSQAHGLLPPLLLLELLPLPMSR